MNVNFEYYKIFYYVAKYCNFTKAANVLHNSQPNITRAMNCLEQELQCTLFIRTNRGVRLTPEGERLYTRVSAAMAQLQAAEEELADSAGLEQGSLCIGVSETALNIYLSQKLKQFHMKYPGVRIKIYNHSTPQAVQSVKNGEIDFAVVTTPVAHDDSLKIVHLKEFHEILVGGQTFHSLAAREMSYEELQTYPLICLGKETMTFRFYRDLFLSGGLELRPDIEAATTDQILLLVRCELGLAFLPEPMASEAVRKGEIIRIPLKEKIPPRYVCMVYDPHYPVSTAARTLKEIIRREV